MGFCSERWFCGWVLAENLNAAPGSGYQTPCDSSWAMPLGAMTQYINCDSCDGGFDARLTRSVTAHRNVYPWHTGPGIPSGAVSSDPSVTLNQNEQFNWRYLSENGEWVAGTTTRPYALKWFFVPANALRHPSGGPICRPEDLRPSFRGTLKCSPQ